MGKPRGIALIITLVVLVAFPVTEVWLLTQLGGLIGAGPTVGLVIVQALLGGWLMKREAGNAGRSMNEAVRAGQTPTTQLADTGIVVIGGLALMFPGLITDVVGLACLIPVTRPLPRKLLTAWAERRIARLGNVSPGAGIPFGRSFGGQGFRRSSSGPEPGQSGYGGGGDVVPGEVVDDPPPAARSDDDAGSDRGSSGSDDDVIIRGELNE